MDAHTTKMLVEAVGCVFYFKYSIKHMYAKLKASHLHKNFISSGFIEPMCSLVQNNNHSVSGEPSAIPSFL